MNNLINNIFNEDVFLTLKKLPDNSVNMIYGDPDYNVGINYAGAKYTQKWNDYIDWYIKLSQECIRVLKPEGNLFMLNYPKQNAYLRVKYLDENAFNVFDYVWVYNTNVGHSPKKFTTAHRSILHITKSKNNNFYKEQVALPYKNLNDKRIKQNIKNGSCGRMPYSWFYYDLVKNVSKDKTFHSCQIPLKLTEMLIKAATKENDLVYILFGGSGSEIVLCKELKRNFISSEIHKPYYDMIINRLNNYGRIDEKYKLKFKKDYVFSMPQQFLL
ncbi:MAG: site-specific DNA-methyltransferase [Elusimicrobiota bacterium]|jgi:site-specific DNA-methyltransferase (adenine-specific)|nr:site-specific DNA-methyltransferase [Elusimicrobiota bacterium]